MVLADVKTALDKVTASIGKVFALVRGVKVEVSSPDEEELDYYENAGLDTGVTVVADGEYVSLKDLLEVDYSDLVEHPIRPYIEPDKDPYL